MQRSWILFLSSLLATLALVAGGVTLSSAPPIQVLLNVEGSISSLSLPAGTSVRDALRSEQVSLESAFVAPSLGTKLEDASRIAVRYERDLTVEINGEHRSYSTFETTVGEALETELSPAMLHDSYVSLPLSTEIPRDGLSTSLVVSTLKLVNFKLNGEVQSHMSSAPTVGDFLDELEVKVDRRDELNRSADRTLEPGMTVSLVEVTKREVRKIKRKALPVVTRWTQTMLKGKSKVLQEPRPRVTKIIELHTFKANKLMHVKTLSQRVLRRGQPLVVLRGMREELAEVEPGSAKAYAQSMLASYGWESNKEWTCLDLLWTKESGWRWNADNPNSSAYGIPQALTALHALPENYMTDYRVQIDWGMDYVQSRYGSPCNAWSHSVKNGFY